MRLDWLTLPLTALTYLQDSGIWNISKIGWGKDNKNHQVLDDGSLKVFYPKGSYSPSKSIQGGIGFYASPENMFPAQELIFSYDVKFDETFQSVLAGKLPGLFFSEGTDKKYMREASGGKHSNTTSSLRIVWRKDFDVEAYVYLPKNQSPEYQQIPNLIQNDDFGDSLWRGLFKFQPTQWNKIMIRVKMNTFDKDGTPNANGILEICINEQRQKFTTLIWTTNPSTSITAILFSTFFGGSSEKYATPVDTWSYFKNFRVKKIQ
jgi:hypothetical protein